MAALNPYYVVMSSLLLSEAVFEPLMLLAICGLAALWRRSDDDRPAAGRNGLLIALSSGAAAGAAILVRPSWGLFVPLVLVVWVLSKAAQGRRAIGEAARGAIVCALGVALVMGPWWIRNHRIYDRFVPTALWLGASLYDGLNPTATGASDMAFLGDRDIWPLDEQDQDAELTRRAIAFARRSLAACSSWRSSNSAVSGAPGPMPRGFGRRTLRLPAPRSSCRSSRYCSWAPGTAAAISARSRCSEGRCSISARCTWCLPARCAYRIPGEIPALGLAAFGWMRTLSRWQGDELIRATEAIESKRAQPPPKSVT